MFKTHYQRPNKQFSSKHWPIGLLICMILSACTQSYSYTEHQSVSNLRYGEEVISQNHHAQWHTQQQSPAQAAISISSSGSQANIVFASPEQPTINLPSISHGTIINGTPVIYPNVYPANINNDCYIIKPAIVNGQQSTIIQSCH